MSNWEETNPVSLKQAKAKIESAFPALGQIAIEHAGTGFDTTVYKVNNQFVFRFPRQEKGKHALENEHRILRELQKNKFQASYYIPEPMYYYPETDEDFPFAGFSYVPGHELAREKDTELLRHDAEKLAGFLRDLHEVPAEAVLLPDELARLSSQKRKPMLEEMLPELREVCEPKTLEMLESYLREIPDWQNPASTHFVHGDLHPKNMIAERGKLTGIIDWGDAHFGHPASDLAVVFQAMPAADQPRFFEEYGQIDEETRKLAIFKAIFISAAVGRYAYLQGDTHTVRWCHAGLQRALQSWYK